MIFKRDNCCNNTINLLLQIIECLVIFRGLIKGLQKLHEKERQSHAERVVSVSFHILLFLKTLRKTIIAGFGLIWRDG